MLRRNLIHDIQTTTQLSSKIISKLVLLAEKIICDDINELDMLGNDVLEIDIGIGKLTLLIADDSLRYDFCPSESLENNIVKTLEEKINPVIVSSELNLDKKLYNTYKDLL